ncbi:MAG: 30S ribosomal protein S8 [Candidatus Schekmanbacteria bacterium]|nr:30S ribosomal protein S8 [Candidatus Schekmanbacteria bacterium]
MLTRIRNANMVGHENVSMQLTKMKLALAEILSQEGYIRSFNIDDSQNIKVLNITLKYGPDNEPVIRGIKRVSKPGLRVYRRATDIPRVVDGMGVAVLTTSKGIMTDKACRKNNVGGELICYIW